LLRGGKSVTYTHYEGNFAKAMIQAKELYSLTGERNFNNLHLKGGALNMDKGQRLKSHKFNT
jgi:hypothetical protein